MVSRRRTRRPQAGFTMIEVMVALLLTVVAVIGVVALYMVEARSSGFSRHESEASVLAEDKLEWMRTINAPCNAGVACTVMSGTDTGINEEEQAGGIYTRTWSITPVSAPAPSWWDLSVTVTWSEDGIARSVTEVGRF